MGKIPCPIVVECYQPGHGVIWRSKERHYLRVAISIDIKRKKSRSKRLITIMHFH
ncbi:MAG: hypothetical protein QXI48_01880 [Candidatus Bathyarchaeia archaeon]